MSRDKGQLTLFIEFELFLIIFFRFSFFANFNSSDLYPSDDSNNDWDGFAKRKDYNGFLETNPISCSY